MTPEQVAGHVMLTDLHNDVHMVGPFRLGTEGRTVVRMYLKNGYGISLVTDLHGENEFPSVIPIQKVTDAEVEREYIFSFVAHPNSSGVMDSEPECTPERAHEILTHLKNQG